MILFHVVVSSGATDFQVYGTMDLVTEVRETRVRSLGQEDPLEDAMATHFSILAWRIPMVGGAWWATVCRIIKIRT